MVRTFILQMGYVCLMRDHKMEGVSDQYEASHTSLADNTSGDADIFVTELDLADGASHLPNLIVLNSLLDENIWHNMNNFIKAMNF